MNTKQSSFKPFGILDHSQKVDTDSLVPRLLHCGRFPLIGMGPAHRSNLQSWLQCPAPSDSI